MIAFVLFLTVHFAHANSEVNTIEMKEAVSLEPHSSLSLLDLVDEKSSDDFSAIRKKLSDQVMMVLQEGGEKVELSSRSIVQHLKAALNSSERNSFKFSIPHRVEVSTKQPQLTQKFIEQKLKDEWQARCTDCKIRISDVRLPRGTFKKWDLSIPTNIPKGSFNIPLTLKNTQGITSTYWVQGKVDVLKEVPVAQRALYMGERIQDSDFKYQWQSVTQALDGPPAKSMLVGMKVKVPILANQVIWSRSLEKEKALSRGDHVRVVYKEGAWELTLSAIAEKDAEIGDSITLKNPATNKSLVGLVVGKGQVEIQ